MKILAVGGGSGGHVTPIAAVLNELIILTPPDTELRVWCDKPFYAQTVHTMQRVSRPITVERIFSGKLRRYHNLSVWQHVLRFRSIVWPNLRDSVFILIGIIQSCFKLLMWKPDVVFCKGGYVSLPVGIAARMLGIPVVLHDSDAHAGLTNRVLSRWAVSIGTGAPAEYYNYPSAKVRYIGIPINKNYRQYSANESADYKVKIGFKPSRPLVVITGGGLGADVLNSAASSIIHELTAAYSVLLLCGEHAYATLAKKLASVDPTYFQLHAFISTTIVETLAAADLVVTRAGATTLLELAALAKPTIIIPSPYLTGGHQLKNAKVYGDAKAAILIDQIELSHNPHRLLDTIDALLVNPVELADLSHNIHAFSKPAAAHDMAILIIDAAK